LTEARVEQRHRHWDGQTGAIRNAAY